MTDREGIIAQPIVNGMWLACKVTGRALAAHEVGSARISAARAFLLVLAAIPGSDRMAVWMSGVPVLVPLSRSFWRSCPELRSAAIGQWLLRNGLAPWPRGAPPAVVLSPAGTRRFQLRLR